VLNFASHQFLQFIKISSYRIFTGPLPVRNEQVTIPACNSETDFKTGLNRETRKYFILLWGL